MIAWNPGLASKVRLNVWIKKAVIACVLSCPRLYPVGTTVQRYPVKDIVLQNYHIPAGVSLKAFKHTAAPPPPRVIVFNISTQTMVQACLYPLGRSAEVFEDPLRFDPGRWGKSREEGQRGGGTGFRSLAFGFGARQCVGRRIAENEMQLLLMHVGDRIHVG